MKNIIFKAAGIMLLSLPLAGITSCSDEHMVEVNTDDTKTLTVDPNSMLTTGLLQTYGDFGFMDTYRSYITGFTQHCAGSWNVTNYAGSVYANNDQSSLLWDRLYGVAIKNMVYAIHNSEKKPNINAILRIHRVYLMSVLTDTYGDVPCSQAGLVEIFRDKQEYANPKYDKQEDIYNWFFQELEACIEQLGKGATDDITGDVTSLRGDLDKWQRYANSLRMRFAMRISDVAPEKAKEEFEKAYNAPCGFIDDPKFDTYVIYLDSPFTLYDGSRELDFRANALGEVLYGQDPTSPSFVCATLFNQMSTTGDPRLYRICRHYLNVKRSEVTPDEKWNVDVTPEVRKWEEGQDGGPAAFACKVGCAWYNNWVTCPGDADNHSFPDMPTLNRLVKDYPDAGFDLNNCHNRMLRPFVSVRLEKPNCPGILMTNAEVEFLLAEALVKGWSVSGTIKDHYENGVRKSIQLLNNYYDIKYTNDEQNCNDITMAQIDDFLTRIPVGDDAETQKKNINTQAWILHFTNPNEAWANLRRADYPVLADRNNIGKWDGFTYGEDLTTPVRLSYPNLEGKYNKASMEEAVNRFPNKEDNWHNNLWWDVNPGRFE